MTGYKVITAAVRAEAAKWDQLAEEIAPAHTAVQGMTLSWLSFSALDAISVAFPFGKNTAPAELQRAYDDMRGFMDTLLGGAKTEFGEIGDTLVKIANTYDQNEEISEKGIEDAF
ncbi:hypothetical protein JOF53_003611 [Crossiella equi]|uniref:Uncharacterized protein n=1 Tax=Crossiella equi TaxID=130796 RepID=A0ABS5ADT8_9PSEU|nr:hypothetical protein [Crossiella equi]MBP2474739.1 hypothetical protein [Crossiella equi]